MAIPADVAIGQAALAAKINEIIDAVEYNRTLWVPVTHGTEMIIALTYPVARCDAQNEYGVMSWDVPAGFTSLVTAEVIIHPTATQAAANIDISSSYHAEGEAYNIHAESDAATTYNLTNDERYDLDVSGILSSLAVGDVVGIKVLQGAAAHNFYIFGLRIKWA